MSPRAGIVIRTKNRPDFLARALRDVGAQTSTDWRIIVVNDGGAPGEVDAVVAAFSASDHVDVLHIAPGDGGRCVAANIGIRAVKAAYVVLHDDDDLWHPDFLKDTIEWLDAHPEAGGVSVRTEIVYEELRAGRWTERRRVPFWKGMSAISLTDMLSINRVVPISLLYRTSLHDRVGYYDESLDAVEDWDFYLRVMPVAKIGMLPGEARAFWTQRPSARGAAGNSMFELQDEHARDDAIVRDRALAVWIAENGAGLPLALAAMERRMDARLAESTREIVEELRREMVSLHPIWTRVRGAVRRNRDTSR